MIDHMLALAHIIWRQRSSQAAAVERVKACWNWFWVHSCTNMIRVAAHKPGSVSSPPQSATVPTALTQTTDPQWRLRSPQLFHCLFNWHLFTWLLIHSTLPAPPPKHSFHQVYTRSSPSTPAPPHPPPTRQLSFGVYAFTRTCNFWRIWKVRGSLWGVKMKSALLLVSPSQAVGKWGVHGVLVM